jgi:hypothetical protein
VNCFWMEILSEDGFIFIYIIIYRGSNLGGGDVQRRVNLEGVEFVVL